MKTQTLENFKNLFIEIKRNSVLENLGREDQNLTGKSGDEIDQTTRERDEQLILKLQGRQRFYLKKVDAALERISNGTFGECTDCGDEISETRLLARPTADLCICCKEDQERGEEHVLYEKKSHTLGKQILTGKINPSLVNTNPGDDNVVKFHSRSEIDSINTQIFAR
ncbi:TraR/DksA family transcriptional regulator [Halobacteriovorax sp.]|uniref:TraR/DksA family transcriptional regulator n=1 Tax=Halobacteriovorax sp. TaxID=2020862 RepID=UPI0035690D9E